MVVILLIRVVLIALLHVCAYAKALSTGFSGEASRLRVGSRMRLGRRLFQLCGAITVSPITDLNTLL